MSLLRPSLPSPMSTPASNQCSSSNFPWCLVLDAIQKGSPDPLSTWAYGDLEWTNHGPPRFHKHLDELDVEQLHVIMMRPDLVR